MLFLLTLALFVVCLLAVFIAQRAQLAQERRRAAREAHHLPPPSGRPVPVPGDGSRGAVSADLTPEAGPMR